MPDQLTFSEPARTDMYCTECGRNFIALIDYRIDGAHVIECPWCRHEHCRVVSGGKVTEQRWESREQRKMATPALKVWKSDAQPIQTSSASHFLRQRWLERDE